MLSWDQVRHATVFVTPDDDEEAARDLPGFTAAQLEERAKFHRVAPRATRSAPSSTDPSPGAGTATPTATATGGSSPPRKAPSSTPPSSNGPSGSARTPSPGCGAPRPRAAPTPSSSSPATTSLAHPGPDPTVVVVHVDADVVDGTAEGNGSIDGIPVPVDTVRRLLCDCEIEYSVDGPDGTCIGIGRAGRTPPRWLRRRLTHRDGTCRFPGCERRIRHLHHIQHWTKDGPTDSYNLAGLCWEHHHLVHEGGWTIEGNADARAHLHQPLRPPAPLATRPLDPKVRRRAQDASDTDLGATCDDLPPTGTDPPR